MATRAEPIAGAEVRRSIQITVAEVPARSAAEREDGQTTRAKAPISTSAQITTRAEKRAAVAAAIAPNYRLICESGDGTIWIAEAVDGDYEFPVLVVVE